MRYSAMTVRPLNQRGQASVFVLAFLGVILVCTVFLYQAGRITSNKMQLQNAADAASYGVSVLEARSLNFAAYTNRAMVANEVAVGQLVGLLSWADELTTAEVYGDAYDAILEAAAAVTLLIPGVGEAIEAVIQVISVIMQSMTQALVVSGEVLDKAFEVLVNPAIEGLSLINQSYSISQEIYHGGSYVLGIKNIYQSLEDNVVGASFNKSDIFKKDLNGPRLSDLGMIALAGHLPSYWSGYTKVYSSSKAPKKKKKGKGKDKDSKKDKTKKHSKKKKKKKADSGMGRLAATIREARDPFSSGENPKSKNRAWRLGFGFDESVDFNFVLVSGSLGIRAFLGGESQGGSELRTRNKTFIWSAADTLVLGARASIYGKAKVPLVKSKSFDLPLPLPDIPFGSGGVQAPGKTVDALLPTDLLPAPYPPSLSYGDRDPAVYAGAGSPSHLLAWPMVATEMENPENVLEEYKGLQPYRDMAKLVNKKPGHSGMPFQAPYFLVGFTWPLHDITRQGPQFTGHLDLIDYDADGNVDRLGVISKSQLYFARPTNLKYFARKDRKKEKPNVFSPFWQARLADTSNADRFMALAMQQKTLWLTEEEKSFIGGSALDSILSGIDEILELASGVLDRIIRLFL